MGEGAAAQSWSPTDAVGFSWRLIKRKPEAIGVLFVAGLVGQALAIPGSIVGGIVQATGGRDAVLLGTGIRILASLVNVPIAVFFAMTATRYCLKLARGEEAGFGEIFAGGPYLSYLGASLLMGIAITFGFALCIVPGVLLALGWFFVAQILVDRQPGATASLGLSWELTKGHRGDLFLFWLLLIGLNLLGLLACCVGVIVTGAMTQLALAWAYLRLTGQATAAA
jgi:hypothetical protein